MCWTKEENIAKHGEYKHGGECPMEDIGIDKERMEYILDELKPYVDNGKETTRAIEKLESMDISKREFSFLVIQTLIISLKKKQSDPAYELLKLLAGLENPDSKKD